MYSDLPAGQIGLSQMWSGDIINAVNYLPEGTGPEILRYWFPSDGKGLVDNDLIVLLRGGKNPVLAHLFLNHMLDPEVAKQNFQQIGYQPPQVSLNPDSLVADGLVPENLKSAIVRARVLRRRIPAARAGRRPMTLPGTMSGAPSRPGDPDPGGPRRGRRPQPGRRRSGHATVGCGPCWPCPASSGWLLFFLAPLYVVLAIVFGQVDPIFRTPIPVWNPLEWDPSQFSYVLTHIVGANGVFGPALLRTAVYVVLASVLCLLIAFPVAYYTARLSGTRGPAAAPLLIAPFWISYMMRMLAWVNLLQDDGMVNRCSASAGCSTSTCTG